ncbi:sensor histidine kinase [Candidatus Nitrosocosmicus arcticus]|uniref:histidine kinase n=1 Tax=Candidatus Nitrosocosmicus arcticus TaxID=2035267 RepID=A0A557SUQ2_9ARCH|nr:HAMP domain-containing sensor histidine kinase [Candidatus Nitrosocosmicus arcticus]TVP40330.1 putative signal transduction histidine kinase with phosphoacceptor and ATP binding domain [Candidatus Nitrosocosmicus arcticus]
MSLFDIKRTKFNSSEVISDFSHFKRRLLDEVYETKDELQLVCSSTGIFEQFIEILEGLFLHIRQTQTSAPKIRLLFPKSKKVNSFLEKTNISDLPSVEIQYIHEDEFQYFIAGVDKSISLFSEPRRNFERGFNDSFFNVISLKDSVIWHNSAIFESLWKQSILENKVKDLSRELNRNNVSNHNFVRILAHELKNPIQPILGFSDMIQNNKRLDSDQKNELLKIISRNARKLDIMTNNILDYARMENNIFNLNLEIFDIVQVIEELLGDYTLQVNKKNIKLDLDTLSKKIMIKADKIRIIEVIDNLLSNSIKFTERGQIVISVRETDQYIVVKIADTGCGIDEKNHKKLFSKFYTTDKLGTGLGLYISRIIIEKHLGRIEGRTNTDGIGSSFTIKLPVK